MDTSRMVVERKAVYSAGGLGSLYNLDKDQVLYKLHEISSNAEKLKISKCKIIYGRATESENLLQMIGVQDDLRLSILLNLVPRTGLIAIIDYPLPIDEHTRFLHYTYIRKIQNLNDRQMTSKEAQLATLPPDATHLITSITWGIELVIVLQLPHVNETANQIDIVLNNLSSNLNGIGRIHNPLLLTSTEQDILQRVNHTKIYSNIPRLADMETIREIYHEIHLLQGNKPGHRPIDFKLHFIPRINSISHINDDTLTARHKTCKKDAEDYLLQLSKSINYLKLFFSRTDSQLLYKHLKEKRSEVNTRYSVVEKQYKEEIKRWEKFIVGWRENEISITQIEQVLNDEQQQALKRNMVELIDDVKCLEKKEEFINDLQQKHFDYYNVTGDDVEKVFQTFIKGGQYDRVLCSSDQLNTNKPSEFDRLRDQLFEEHQSNSVLRLLYADFSSCSFKLPDLTILPKDNTSNVMNPPITTATSTEESINILLLGESGVGKSTFINAFVNYLTFNTLEEAESNKPLALIPVSFLMTTGDNFTEHTVKLEVSDLSNNEDFQHPGQSVTQHCRSYVFQLKHQAGKKLRIIDTLGFGDTRGLAQDDLNMQHILEYINQFTHLNAVCFLLKPNESRLNIFFRTCLIQLFDFLGTDVRQNIIFCFTNSRPTFYTPGNTAPLLKAMLQSISSANIPFQKKNAYCFDSKSFRYLTALKHGITFDNQERCEYEASWVKSMTEFNRLLNYIQQNTVVHRLNDSCKSIKQAQLQIIQMIRPMLESIRNCLRNIILHRHHSSNKFIAINPRSLGHPITICLLCEHERYQIAYFWFSTACEADIQDNNHNCSDASNQHLTIEYVLDYDTSSDQSTLNENELKNQMYLLIDIGAAFSTFLMFTAVGSTTDLFLTGLTRMYDEEKNLYLKRKDQATLNQKLSEELERMIREYTDQLSKMQQNEKDNEPLSIYNLIQILRDIPEIHIQLEAVRKTHENMIKKYDCEVPSDPTNTTDSRPVSC